MILYKEKLTNGFLRNTKSFVVSIKVKGKISSERENQQ